MTPITLWPIITLIFLLVVKRVVIGYPDALYPSILLDCLIVAFFLVLSIKRGRFFTWVQSIIAGLIIFYLWLDITVYLAIHYQLTYNTFMTNWKDYHALAFFISPKLIVFSAVTLTILIITSFIKPTLNYDKTTCNLLAYEIILVLFVAYFAVRSYSHGFAKDYFDLSTKSFAATSLNNETLEYVRGNFENLTEDTQKVLNGSWPPATTGPKTNIIIVVSESLSGVDSKYAGGLFDRLPNIDKIQESGIAFKNMYSNGKITMQGIAALLLGVVANQTGGFPTPLDQFPPDKFNGNNVVAYAKAAGYDTIAVRGFPGKWQNVSDWYRKMGFDMVIDRESDAFKNVPRFTWDAPADESLYNETLKELTQHKKPVFLVIETISLHQPYVSNGSQYKTSDSDLLNQINYVDQSTYAFYNKLRQQNFFNNGILIILGDHRRFEALEKPEEETGGYPIWHERIVGTIVGKGIQPNQLLTMPFTTVDINGILHMIIENQPVNAANLLKAKLSTRVGINTPLAFTLADESHGSYLIRSEEYKPLFISIFGTVPFDKIPNRAYREGTAFLILNNAWLNTKVKTP